ncbi:hypothetical protein [Candidatus Endomicrobiellum agilis]|uniref:hypothetical protein n=1 Tax=Candidatus Endomicrobiellum agilis TaxID=3238957 RepID=UPI00358769BE|nr:hypothetical protein [Endomicrobium sp.]
MLGCGQQTKSADVPTEAHEVSPSPNHERDVSGNTTDGDSTVGVSNGVASYIDRGMSWSVAHWKAITITATTIATAVILYKYDLHGKAWEKTKKGMKWTWEMVKLSFEKDRKLFAKKADLGSDKSNSDSDKQKKKLNKEQNVHRNSSSNKGGKNEKGNIICSCIDASCRLREECCIQAADRRRAERRRSTACRRNT